MFRKETGLTIVETMVSTAILSIGLSLAVPSWKDIVSKREVTGGAEEVAAFITHAQSYALKSNQEVTVTFTRASNGESWCLGAIDANAKQANSLDHCDCDSGSQCTLDGQLKVIDESVVGSVVALQSRVLDTPSLDFNFNFDPVRGLIVTDLGTVDSNRYGITLKSANAGHKLSVSTLATGRTRICNPTGNDKNPAYKACGS